MDGKETTPSTPDACISSAAGGGASATGEAGGCATKAGGGLCGGVCPAGGAGVAIGQQMAQALSQGLNRNPGTTVGAAAPGAVGAPATESAAIVRPEEVMATIERLHELHTRGALTAEEFDAKKAELLKKLV